MRVVIRFVGAMAFVLLVVTTPSARGRAQSADDLARETLRVNDGWGSFSTGTTGGSAATADHVYTATNRNELVAALATGATPKIVYISGTIDGNVDASGQPLACGAYEAPGYSLAAYLAAYDPATWGRTVPTGPLETARRASQANQQARVRINIPANTTLIGLGGATIVGANLRVNNTDNVIIRNITFLDAHDCFPAWDPTDGSTGNWNSAYDNLSLIGATHVWVDRCAFSDGDNPDSGQPFYFDRPFQVHDGELDITNGSDLITVSWNQFTHHDKVMLIGSSDSSTLDPGKLRVTIHHNVFAHVIQRAPRVRFGEVHLFNNFYVLGTTKGYGYSWGVGVQSQIYAQNNFFQAGTVPPDQFISRLNGTAIYAAGSFVNGVTPANRVDLVGAYNATHDPDLSPVVRWVPVLFNVIHPTEAVPGLVGANAGPLHGRLAAPTTGEQ
jgi:pectate lyase